jgi:hypothetical protein
MIKGANISIQRQEPVAYGLALQSHHDARTETTVRDWVLLVGESTSAEQKEKYRKIQAAPSQR